MDIQMPQYQHRANPVLHVHRRSLFFFFKDRAGLWLAWSSGAALHFVPDDSRASLGYVSNGKRSIIFATNPF
jgi:hypothetical protein